jgi:glycyl-tRNA synthetase
MEPIPSPVTLDKIVALCKRRGFVFQAAEIYGGLNGVYDFGPLGTLLKNNIRSLWSQAISNAIASESVVFFDGSILTPASVWDASGHTKNFHDPLVDCLHCKHRYRADDLDLDKPCPHCGIKNWSDVRTFQMMFKTQLGAVEGQSAVAYLRPETAQSIFINFKNIYSTSRVKIPFGVAQMGKAFRNEITPKQFLFRMREFEQMELEWFCKAENSLDFHKKWCDARIAFYSALGISKDKIRLRAHDKEELSHYSTATSDVEYLFPFGWKELEGIAYRGNYDLKQHMENSGKDLTVFDEASKESYLPHVVECSVGTDRLFLTLLFDAYHEEVMDNEQRIVLRFHPDVAPYKAAFFPLTKKQSEPMKKIYDSIKKLGYSAIYDESGSIGKRYRRNDEIGTPVCFTYDFESEEDNCVTVRHRDTMQQERIAIDKISEYLAQLPELFHKESKKGEVS